MISLMYVSVSELSHKLAEREVEDILRSAIVKNEELSVTGALIFTGTYFAQALEGSANSVDGVMTSIHRDNRHQQVTVVDRSRIEARRFATWNMAYQGNAGFVNLPIQRLLVGGSKRVPAKNDVNRIYAIMSEFVRDQAGN